jgi:hypothetical protein
MENVTREQDYIRQETRFELSFLMLLELGKCSIASVGKQGVG